jgi:acetolactate synthase-1/2/3 large subunit
MHISNLTPDAIPVPEAVIRVLEEAGVTMVFGMPGGNSKPFFDALVDHPHIRTVLVRHEALSGVMAEAYGRLTGVPGVSTGQGAWMVANGMLGVLEAHMGSSPMIVLTDFSDNAPFTHHAPYQIGTGDYGGWDIRNALGSAMKRVFTPYEGPAAVQSVQLALKHALSGEPGPVAVIFHSSVLKENVGPQSVPRLYPTSHYLPPRASLSNIADLPAAVDALAKARTPAIIVGNGSRADRAFDAVERLAEVLGAPMVTTAAGKGTVNESHPLALGVMGNHGLPAANAAISEADVVLVVGSKMSPTDTVFENDKLLDPNRQIIIQVEIEPRNASWSFPVRQLIGDARLVVDLLREQLTGKVDQRTLADRGARVDALGTEFDSYAAPELFSDATPILPQRAIRALNDAIEDDAFVTCDAGENRLFMNYFFRTKAGGTMLTPGNSGGMGYAIPAALAAKLVFPERQAIAVCGDGGFALSMNGLLTALDENIPIVVVILNNSVLGWVKHQQAAGRVIASEFPQVDFAAVARAMGCHAERVTEPADLDRAIRAALAAGVPAVVDVVTSEVPSYLDLAARLEPRAVAV